MPPIQPDHENKHAIALNFRSFESQVLYFNGMYNLPCPSKPDTGAVVKNERTKLLQQAHDSNTEADILATSPVVLLMRRLEDFKKTLLKEIEEVDDIREKLIQVVATPRGEEAAYKVEDFFTDLADWLGDIQVYCASEMAKFGLPNNEILSIIMQSNFSKLQLDGSTMYDEAGKVMKGPLYWKPEPRIKQLIVELIECKPQGE